MAEGGRKGYGHTEGDAIPVEPVKNLQKGKVGFGKGFKIKEENVCEALA
jgi:hypothetical protein